MEVGNIASLATSMAQARTGEALGAAVLKKTRDIQSAGAAALLAALPGPAPARLPPHLGQHIDVTA